MSEQRRSQEEAPKDRFSKPKKSGKLASMALTTAMTLGSVAGMESQAHAAEPAAARAEQAEKKKAVEKKHRPKTQSEIDREAVHEALGRANATSAEDLKAAAARKIDEARAAAERQAETVKEKVKKDLGIDDASMKAYRNKKERERAKREKQPKKPGRTASAIQGFVNWFLGSPEQPKDPNKKPAK
jgi:hypothetical protein